MVTCTIILNIEKTHLTPKGTLLGTKIEVSKKFIRFCVLESVENLLRNNVGCFNGTSSKQCPLFFTRENVLVLAYNEQVRMMLYL